MDLRPRRPVRPDPPGRSGDGVPPRDRQARPVRRYGRKLAAHDHGHVAVRRHGLVARPCRPGGSHSAGRRPDGVRPRRPQAGPPGRLRPRFLRRHVAVRRHGLVARPGRSGRHAPPRVFRHGLRPHAPQDRGGRGERRDRRLELRRFGVVPRDGHLGGRGPGTGLHGLRPGPRRDRPVRRDRARLRLEPALVASERSMDAGAVEPDVAERPGGRARPVAPHPGLADDVRRYPGWTRRPGFHRHLVLPLLRWRR